MVLGYVCSVMLVNLLVNQISELRKPPDDRLEALAKEQGWEIQDWSI